MTKRKIVGALYRAGNRERRSKIQSLCKLERKMMIKKCDKLAEY
jgi:hypothetical protein